MSSFGFTDQESGLVITPECVYFNPCDNQLEGTLRVAPRLGRYDLNEIIAREWMPESAIQVVCELNPGQEAMLTGTCAQT